MDPVTRETAWEELIRLKIRGATDPEAAAMLGFPTSTIKFWLSRPDFKLKLLRTKRLIFNRTKDVVEERASEAVVEVEKLIAQYSEKAITKIANAMESTNESIQLRAAMDLADRNPRTSKTKKVQGAVVHAFLTPEVLAAAARVAKELNEDHAVGRHVEPLELEPIMGKPLDDEDDGKFPLL